MKPMKSWAWLAPLCLLVCAGCYTYGPVQTLRPGMEVRARLKTEAAVRRSQGLDEATMRLDGVIVESTLATLSLDVLVARSSSVFQNVVIRDTVQLQTAEVESILQRRLSPVRSAVFALGAAAGAYALLAGIQQITGGNPDENDPGDPALRMPMFSVTGLRSMRLFGIPFR